MANLILVIINTHNYFVVICESKSNTVFCCKVLEILSLYMIDSFWSFKMHFLVMQDRIYLKIYNPNKFSPSMAASKHPSSPSIVKQDVVLPTGGSRTPYSVYIVDIHTESSLHDHNILFFLVLIQPVFSETCDPEPVIQDVKSHQLV